MIYAVVGDVEVEYGPIAPTDHDRVEALIDRVETYLHAEVPDLPDRVNSGRTKPELVVLVVSELVAESLRNPQRLRNFAHTEGPFTTSGTYAATDSGADGGGLSTRHRRLLGDRPDRGAFTVMPGR